MNFSIWSSMVSRLIKNIGRSYIFFLAAFFCFQACEKQALNSESDIVNFEVLDPPVDGFVNQDDHSVLLTFPPEVLSAEDLVTEFILSEGASATVDDVLQISGESRNNYELPFQFAVTAEDGLQTIDWNIVSTNNSYSLSWGLGGFLKEAHSSLRTYEWYIDQGNTGEFSNDNCGPASVTMAAKWSDETFTNTVLDARAAYRPEGGWWYTNDISGYLSDHKIPYTIVNLSNTWQGTQDTMQNYLSNNKILILCLDMYKVSMGSYGEEKVDKFYYTNAQGWGHFIVVKGYKIVDGKLFWEVYDSNSWGKKYKDGTLKGKDRYYRSKDIFVATFEWWNHAFVIAPKDDQNKDLKPANLNAIPRKMGR